MGVDMNWTQSYAANKNAQRANANAIGAAVAATQATQASTQATQAAQQATQASHQATQAAIANGMADLAILDNIKEMREWEIKRFNCIVDYVKDNNQKITALQEEIAIANNKRAEENKILLETIDNLHRQLAEVQAQLYQEQEKNQAMAKGFAR